jgi:hypothetical protein
VLLAPAALAAAFAFDLYRPAPCSRPGLNVGAPGRAVLVLVLAVPALAAFGLDPTRLALLAWTLVRVAPASPGSAARRRRGVRRA